MNHVSNKVPKIAAIIQEPFSLLDNWTQPETLRTCFEFLIKSLPSELGVISIAFSFIWPDWQGSRFRESF